MKALVGTFNKMEALLGASSEHCETTGYMKLRWQLSFDTSADVIFSVAGSGGPRKPISHGELYHTFCLASTWLQGTSILRQFLKLYTLFVYLQRHQTHLYLFPDITRSVTLFTKIILAFQETCRGGRQRPGWVQRCLVKSSSRAVLKCTC